MAETNNYFSENKKRFETRGIAEGLSLEIRILIWKIIVQRREKGQTMDYLQVFRLTPSQNAQGEPVLIIRYSQEVPEVSKEYKFTGIRCTEKTKIYCIDDGADYVTMLYASEY